MGSGKTTVGPLLAEALAWAFVDADEEVERREGRDISRIFSEAGEEAFRQIERRVTDELLARDEIVLATGGGWPCRDDRLENAPSGTLTVWLRVSPEGALDRIRGQAVRRPLLEVDDPLGRTRELLARREPHYRKAQWWVDTERHTPREIVRRMSEGIETDPGRPLRI